MSHSEIKEMVKSIWGDGVVAHIEIDRLYDPSNIQQGIDEMFEEYWEENQSKLIYKIVQE